ncbi:MAG: hypothetical protein WD029_10320 [Microthrixaceae bacterium]
MTNNSGQAVLDWLNSSKGKDCARTLLYRYRIGRRISAEDLIAEAQFNVWKRTLSAVPFEVDSAPAYATTVLKNIVLELNSGQHDISIDEIDYETGFVDAAFDQIIGENSMRSTGTLGVKVIDEIRVLIEEATISRPWVTSGALSYLTMFMEPESKPSHTPSPQSGATPDQARSWPALWLSGAKSLFCKDLTAAQLRMRSRKNLIIREAVSGAFARYQSKVEGQND